MRRLLLVIAVFLSVGLSISKIHASKNKPKNIYQIGILQTASFPPLDQANEGFKLKMKALFGDKVQFIEQNAQGSITQAQAIASSFQANSDIDAFYAIATPALEALKQQIKNRPILFSAVTDPESLHIRDNRSNITGCTDMPDVQKQIDLLVQKMPQLKKVALLYSAGEPNSTIIVAKMKKELLKKGIEFEDSVANGISEVSGAALHAVNNAQVVLIPTDNTMASAMPIIMQLANKNKVPVVVTWTGEIHKPFMQFGVNYLSSGESVALQMHKILVNKVSPKNVPIELPQSKSIFLNGDVK